MKKIIVLSMFSVLFLMNFRSLESNESSRNEIFQFEQQIEKLAESNFESTYDLSRSPSELNGGLCEFACAALWAACQIGCAGDAICQTGCDVSYGGCLLGCSIL